MIEQGTFPEGIIVDGIKFKEFTLDEQRFRHTLEIMNDPAAKDKVEDPVWYSAALLARRMTVEGLEHITAEMVLDLSGPDGDELTRAGIALEQRRRDFRNSLQARENVPDSPAEAGAQLDED